VSEKVLMSGNHIVGKASVLAGCRFYAGYPITPQNELTEYMAGAMAGLDDGNFIQAESEIAAINMVIGASVAGCRAMTSSSSPGISLKQEGISFLSAMELPAVIVNCMRGGPGLGNIAPSQGDYFQATRGGGHGDYRNIVLGPASGQELADLTRKAFYYADEYRIPVIILQDGMMGQIREPVIFPEPIKTADLPLKPWKLDGAKGRPSRIIKSLLLDPKVEEDLNWKSSESKWSIAQIMQHIITTNRSYFPLFNLIKNNKFNSPWIGKFPPLPSFMGKMILSYVRPDMKKKSKTVEIWEPSYSIIPVEILNRFKLHQEEFMQWIDLLDEYFDTNLIIRSPASRIIVYSLDTAIEIMVAHEERHLNQARDVLRVKDQ